jgi:hypothetical protein
MICGRWLALHVCCGILNFQALDLSTVTTDFPANKKGILNVEPL